MASIIKRKNKYSVVYRYIDENGTERQKWESFTTQVDARKRKKEIERQKEEGTFEVPTTKTLSDLIEDYISIYGVANWAMSTYESRQSLYKHYIEPYIGKVPLKDITPKMMDNYYKKLQTVKAVRVNNVDPKSEYLTPHTIREIHKILRNAFNQAVRWELMTRNPVEHANLPRYAPAERKIWTADILFHAIEVCDDNILKLAMNVTFSCTLRLGEMLGLTWDCVDVSEESIKSGSASIYINKELQRVKRDSLEKLNDRGIILKFPASIRATSTRLVLKEPKTKSSVRRIYLPKSVAEMLIQRKKDIDDLKALLGDEYLDFNLVFCGTTGRPMEGEKYRPGLRS